MYLEDHHWEPANPEQEKLRLQRRKWRMPSGMGQWFAGFEFAAKVLLRDDEFTKNEPTDKLVQMHLKIAADRDCDHGDGIIAGFLSGYGY